jgi:tRNA-2-methylthio-N6-dimethylallyladenosine synthase
MAQRMGESLLEKAPYVDMVMGPDAYRELPKRLVQIEDRRNGGPARRQGAGLAVVHLDIDENYEGLEQRRRSSVAAWVPIQRGCNHRCTYCIVPYVRGPEKNRSAEAVLDEVRTVAESGITEVTLLGQTVNSYQQGDWTFARLLRAAARTPGLRRVRFVSPHPNDVTPELVEVMAEEPSVCEHLHLPVQSGSDRTLKRMLRRHTIESYLQKVDMLRSSIPDLALTTDLIVAFPGETEEEFRETLELMRTIRYDDAFTYKYSPREGTPATRLPPDQFVDPDVAQRRLEELIRLMREIQLEINRASIGAVEEVLVERPARLAGQVMGRTRGNKAVAFPGEESWVGEYVRVQLTSTSGATFVGRAETDNMRSTA